MSWLRLGGLPAAAGLIQHPERFPHSGRIAEEYLEAPFATGDSRVFFGLMTRRVLAPSANVTWDRWRSRFFKSTYNPNAVRSLQSVSPHEESFCASRKCGLRNRTPPKTRCSFPIRRQLSVS
jgi:hypothetical protein